MTKRPECPDTPRTRRGFALGLLVAAPLAIACWAALAYWLAA
ncbi:hypothetical protein ACXYN8_02830 [Altererythrobacter sp. CAU 1778]